MYNYTDVIKKFQPNQQTTLLKWMSDRIPDVIPHKWPWFVFSYDTMENDYKTTALKWIFSVRHKVNGRSPIKDFKFFACCILHDVRVADNVKDYLLWIAWRSATFSNIISTNVGASYYLYKAQVVNAGILGVSHCERHHKCRTPCAPDRVAFELFWINQAQSGCWSGGAPVIPPILQSFLSMFNVDKINM